jgi:hypothetical protein
MRGFFYTQSLPTRIYTFCTPQTWQDHVKHWFWIDNFNKSPHHSLTTKKSQFVLHLGASKLFELLESSFASKFSVVKCPISYSILMTSSLAFPSNPNLALGSVLIYHKNIIGGHTILTGTWCSYDVFFVWGEENTLCMNRMQMQRSISLTTKISACI